MARATDGSEARRYLVGACAVVAALALGWAAARDAHGATYKWIDDRGVVHYSDKMPVDAVNRGHVELDRQGLRLRKIDAALTAEQVRAREAEKERQREAAKASAETDRRDRQSAALALERYRRHATAVRYSAGLHGSASRRAARLSIE
jgi:hypothetical protein